ncbi:MAG TPA: RNA polymerase sigma factor [Myxococcales bacterium]|jgi:RNA polymerase sigma-70 factor (ECF subfamily)
MPPALHLARVAEVLPNPSAGRWGRSPAPGAERVSRDAADSKLAARARRGDQAAFEEIVRRFQPAIFALCRSVLKDPDEAWDAVQDSLVRLWERLEGYRGEAPLRVFVSRLALHVAIDHRRRHERCPERAIDPLVLARSGDPARSPADAAEAEELGRRLGLAMSGLAGAHRAILALRELEGLSYSEIARALHIPLGTVMSRLFYARRAMRALLEPATEAWAA